MNRSSWKYWVVGISFFASACNAIPLPSPVAPDETLVITSSLTLASNTNDGEVAVLGLDGAATPDGKIRVRNMRTETTSDTPTSPHGAFAVVVTARLGDVLQIAFVDDEGNESDPIERSMINHDAASGLKAVYAEQGDVWHMCHTGDPQMEMSWTEPGLMAVTVDECFLGETHRLVCANLSTGCTMASEIDPAAGHATIHLHADFDDQIVVLLQNIEDPSDTTPVSSYSPPPDANPVSPFTPQE
jgi:hypothetical protein